MSEIAEQHQLGWKKTAEIIARNHSYGNHPIMVMFNIPYPPNFLKELKPYWMSHLDVWIFQFGKDRTRFIDGFSKNQTAARYIADSEYRSEWLKRCHKIFHPNTILDAEQLIKTHQLGNMLFRLVAEEADIKYVIILNNKIVRTHEGKEND